MKNEKNIKIAVSAEGITKALADDLKRKQIRLLNDITNKRMGGTRKTWAEQRHANW